MKINRLSQDYTFYVLNLGSDPMFLDRETEEGKKISEWHLVIREKKNPSRFPITYPHTQFSSFRIKSKLLSLKSPLGIWPLLLTFLYLSILHISLFQAAITIILCPNTSEMSTLAPLHML